LRAPFSTASTSPLFVVESMNRPIWLLTYILDRLYLGAYIHPPNAETLFPYPEASLSPRKRAAATAASKSRKAPCYFSVDDTLLYNAFHHDFGPLHIGHLYRFAIQFHDILGAKENADRPIVFWSAADARSEFDPHDWCLSVWKRFEQGS
jgi:cell division cycle 14